MRACEILTRFFSTAVWATVVGSEQKLQTADFRCTSLSPKEAHFRFLLTLLPWRGGVPKN